MSVSAPVQKDDLRRRSIVWYFFDKQSDHRLCKMCGIRFTASSASSTSNLMKHLRRRHPLQCIEAEKLRNNGMAEWTDKIETVKSTAVIKKRSLSTSVKSTKSQEKNQRVQSVVWYYFDQHPVDRFLSKCKVCGHISKRGNSSSTSNLLKHLRHRHPLRYEEAQKLRRGEIHTIEPIADIEERVQREVKRVEMLSTVKPVSAGLKRQPSVVWYYFEKDKNDLSKSNCKLCGKFLIVHGGSTSALLNHLKSQHPKMYQEAKNRQIFEQENSFGTGDNSYVVNHNDDNASAETSDHPPEIPEIELVEMSKLEPSADSPVVNSSPAKPCTTTTYKQNKERPTTKSIAISASNRLLVKMIAKNMLPASIVSIPEFRQFLTSLNPRYELPTKQTFNYALLPDYADNVDKMVKYQVKLAKFIVLSLERWNYRNTEDCITVMAHFVKENWEMASVVLDSFGISKSDDEISNLKRIVDECAISDNVFAAVFDNEDLSLLTVVLSLGWEPVTCYGQILEKIVNTALESVADISIVRKRTKEVVEYFDTHVKAANVLLSVQQHHNLPQKRLKLEVKGHWISTLKMFERMLDQYEAVNTVLCTLDLDALCLNDDDIDLIRAVINMLEPFKLAASELFKEEFSTMATVIPLSTLLSKAISNITVPEKSKDMPAKSKEKPEKSNDMPKESNDMTVETQDMPEEAQDMPDESNDMTEETQEMPEELKVTKPCSALKQSFIEELRHHFKDVELNHYLAVTTLLDPRFKHHGFTDKSSMETAKQKLLQEMTSLASATVSTDSAIISTSKDNEKVQSIWNMFDTQVAEAGFLSTEASEAENECSRYFKEPIIGRSKDPLSWWNLNKVQFPYLQVMAQKYLAIPANAISASRLKTKLWEDVGKHRNEVKPSDLYKRVFLSGNLCVNNIR